MDGELIQVLLGSNEAHAIENKNELDENLIPFWPSADPEILSKIPKIKGKDTVKFLFIAIDSEKDITRDRDRSPLLFRKESPGKLVCCLCACIRKQEFDGGYLDFSPWLSPPGQLEDVRPCGFEPARVVGRVDIVFDSSTNVDPEPVAGALPGPEL